MPTSYCPWVEGHVAPITVQGCLAGEPGRIRKPQPLPAPSQPPNSWAAARRARLEESRRLWRFLWEVGEAEAWVREQQHLLASAETGRDLTGVLRLLNKHTALRGEMSGRLGPLKLTLEQGQQLVAEGHPGAGQAAARTAELQAQWERLEALAEERAQ